MDSDELKPRRLQQSDNTPQRYPLDRMTEPMSSERRHALEVHQQGIRDGLDAAAPELEKVLLGTAMTQDQVLDVIAGHLKPMHLYDERHQQLYAAMLEVYHASQPVNMITVTEWLKVHRLLDSVGGAFYIGEVAHHAFLTKAPEWYINVLTSYWFKRQLGRLLLTGSQDARDISSDPFEQASQLINEVFNLQSELDGGEAVRLLREDVDALVERALSNEELHLTGLDTGYRQLNELTLGWQPGDLIVIAARPSMGKTAIGLDMMRSMSVDQGLPGSMSSLEMSRKQLGERLFSSETGVNSWLLRKGGIRDLTLRQKIRAAQAKLKHAPIYIDDTPGLDLREWSSRIRRLRRTKDIQYAMVDYLQLMTNSAHRGNREQEIASISRGLKKVAKELEIPVIAFAQLSRAVDQRSGDHRPHISDLRESGSIEQDADVVGFLYRPERYGILEDEAGNSTIGLLEFILGKQRNGPLGTAYFDFKADTGRFVETLPGLTLTEEDRRRALDEMMDELTYEGNKRDDRGLQ